MCTVSGVFQVLSYFTLFFTKCSPSPKTQEISGHPEVHPRYEHFNSDSDPIVGPVADGNGVSAAPSSAGRTVASPLTPTDSNLGETAESTIYREAVSLLSIGNFNANETEDHRTVAIERAVDQPLTPDNTPSIIEKIIKQNKQLLAANGALTKANEVLLAKVETLARENDALKASSAKGGEATEGDRASAVVTEITSEAVVDIMTGRGEVRNDKALALGEVGDGGEGGGIIVIDDRIRQDFERRSKIIVKARKLKLKIDSLTKTMVLFDVFQPGVRAEKGGKGWGRASVSVRAGFEEVAAFFWDVDRLDKNIERFVEKGWNSFEMEVRKILLNSKLIDQVKSKIGRQSTSVIGRSNTSKLDSQVSKLGDMAADSEFFSRMNLYRADEKTIVIISRPVSEIEEASETTAIKISNVGEKKSSVDLITKIELGKAVSRRAARVSAKKLLGTTSDAAYYFDNLLGSAEAVEEDGRRFGEQLMEMLKGVKVVGNKNSIVRKFIEKNLALAELVRKHEFVRTMLCAIVRNKIKRDAAKKGEVENEEEARGWEIGSAMKTVMLTTLTAAHAVDEWSGRFTEVQEIMRDQVWLRPMLEEIVVKLFRNTKLGLKARVTFGAITSMTDLLTDVYVTYMFWDDKKYGYFKASLASLMVSIGLQMLFVWVQNRKLGMTRVLREWIPILLGYKPAVDAYRVATGAKQEVGATMDPMLEMTTMKMAEMFAEAIPGVIIQLMAIATSDKDVGTSAWLSVAVSAITTGFVSATISYDFDTDPGKREETPAFYGYIPAKASKRTIVFVSMLLLTAGMLLIRCTTIVLLGLIEGSWAFLYIGADLVLYLLVKILRGDFWYWMPLGGKAEVANSILGRVSVKIIVDFTSLVQFRHPNEVGGAYWLFGLLLTMVSLPVSIYVASPHVDEKAIDIASTIVKLFIPMTTLCFAVFFWNIEKKYWNTFWSTQKGKEYSMAFFLEEESEAAKFQVLDNSRHQWVSIEGEVKKWVGLNWAKWEEEQPEWFTDVMKAKVPVDFIPADGNARRRESVRRASVDAEAVGGLAGAMRASIRRASVGGADGGDIIGVGDGKAKVGSVVPYEDEE
jgi:hypothetical protein